jgi:diacylglycerol kinase (ATP)
MLKQEWGRFRQRVIWSWAGWMECWRNEPSLKQWVWANVISVGFALMLDLTSAERALIIALGILVLAAEIMNTAIERTVDFVSDDQHPLAKQAKDAASAAVALTAIASGAAWLVILLS